MTKQSRYLVFAVIYIFVFTMFAQADKTKDTIHQINIGDVISQPNSEEASYEVESYSSYFTQSIQTGGFFQLVIKRRSGDVLIKVDDINGIVPIGDEKYLYAVSPVYGNRPGLYLFDASINKEVTLLKAENVMEGYPHGADYFELAKWDKAERVVYYYFIDGPDKTDFSTFRATEFLRNLELDHFSK